jgi:DNA-binding LacI/PurR family transcriptional regulator
MNKRYTIVDLARMLGMSKSTVSRALRDQYDVKPETRNKVLELARKLEFETNALAASLRGNKSSILGVIIPSFDIPFYSIALGGIQQAASAAGYNVMVCQTNESYQNELEMINMLLKSRVDGILISLSKDTENVNHLLKISQRGTPVVMFNRVHRNTELPYVIIDDYQSSLEACRYLVDHGCKSIAHISGPLSLSLSRNRMKGYTDALQEANISVDEQMIFESDFTTQSGKAAAEKIFELPQLPEAVFCVCDAVAIGVMAVIREKGLKIPEDISVMGFTDEPIASVMNPRLTTVSQPIQEIGKTAIELLMEHLRNPGSVHNRNHVVLPTLLIVRESTR